MEIPGYVVLDELCGSRSFRLHRGRASSDNAAVLLKLPARAPVRPRDLDTLEREWRLAREAAGPPLPDVRELVVRGDVACLVLADRGLEPLSRRVAGRRPPLEWVLSVGISICRALESLHARRVAVGTLAPHGVLVGADVSDLEFVDLAWAWQAAPDRLPVPAAVEPTPYVSPEQTGRLNRGVDHRSDLYALGILLYELLVGEPPCASADALELVHFHVAKSPPSPADAAGVPEAVSRVVMRLLAKDPEDRYQSASGVRRDLEACAGQWTAHGAITPFEPGRQDVPLRLAVSRKLHGREREVEALSQAFDVACTGRPALLLVGGYAGVGKTSLISELYRPIVRQRGYFASGKVDQVVRGTPYAALAQAFGLLTGQLLTEDEDRLSAWRQRLVAALGANGGVLTGVIPELEHLLGPQAVPPPLDVVEAQNRFRYVFQTFVGAVATADHPLVLFLDDLQWVDAATLELLHALLTTPGGAHLLVVGAFRDNEVDGQHPLMHAAARFSQAGIAVDRLSLGPLGLEPLSAWLGETLRAGAREVEPLARLMLAKTGGNPFFAVQFLEALAHEGLLRVDEGAGRWTYALDAIERAGITSNVVDLLTQRIRRLSPASQDTLRLAACVGSPFDWGTMLTVTRRAPDEVAGGLAEAVAAGLIVRMPAPPEAPGASPRASYAFVHDRVQQAAYALIPDDRKAPVHLEVGRLLLSLGGGQVPDDRLFEVASHFNLGRDLLDDPVERRRVAAIDLAAARRAKGTAAYRSAAEYLSHGLALAGEAWPPGDDLPFALHLEAAECEYLSGDFERAERLVGHLLRHVSAPLDLAHVHALRIRLYEHQSRWADALASGRDGLRLFGVSLPDGASEKASALERELARIDALRAGRSIASLAGAPEVTDPAMRLVLRLLTTVWAPAYLSGDLVLTRLISATMVRLSLAHGHTADSAYGYVTHAITIGPVRHDYRSAYEWGELALAVDDRLGDPRRRARVYQQFQAHVNPWRRPLATCIPFAREAHRSGLEAGDFTYAGYGAATEAWAAFLTCRDLEAFVRDYTPTLERLDALKMADFQVTHRVLLQWALALQGRTAGPLALSDGEAEEAALVADIESRAPFFRTFVHVARLHLGLVFGQHEDAVAAWARARAVAPAGTIWPVMADAWGGLALCARGALSPAEREQVEGIREALGVLASDCPENFQGWWLLLSAALARADGRWAESVGLCDAAASHARESGAVSLEALASEAGARTLAGVGASAASAALAREAHRLYAEWGAHAKVHELERSCPQLLPARAAPVSASAAASPTGGDTDTSLDMATVLKLAQAIAVEIDVDGLLRKLMTIAMENAGAKRGVFLAERDRGLTLEAEATADPEQVVVGPPARAEASDRIPRSIVQFVRRTGRDLVLANASADERFSDDPYVASSRTRSVLCLAVSHQGRLGGILYLENDLTSGAFTPARAELVRIVAAQAAISLENARLYEGVRDEVARRTAAEGALREALRELEGLKNRLQAENVYLQEEIRTAHNFAEIVGNSAALRDALRRVEQVAPTTATVLIAGETGTGKEIVARAIHSRSARRDRPLVKVNCGAIPAGLVESELFGHVKGAFTGALHRRVGRFELADGGSIFLDEVGELPAETQVKLLRVLQEQEFEPVGAAQTVRVDVRVIAATNRDLEALVRAGSFRADLYYRLNVFPIEVPPLRDRREDIPLLVAFFLSSLAKKLGKPLDGFTAGSLDRLRRYSWPGNVRELQNVVERAAILATGPIVDLQPGLLPPAPVPAVLNGERPVPPLTLEELERRHILEVVSRAGWRIEGPSGAAGILGLHPNTLRSRMKKLGIVRRPSEMS